MDGTVVTPEIANGVVPYARDVEQPAADEDFPDSHLISRERPRLVGADYGSAAQGLHSREAPDDGSAPGSPLHADGQGAGHDGRQGFGDGRDGEAHPPDEHFQHRVASEDAHADNAGGDHETRNPQPLADEVHLHGERGWLLFDRLEQGRNPAELCPHSGGGHDRLAPAIGNEGARKHHVPAVADPRFLVQDHCRVLLHGSRFPGKRGLLGAQIGHVQEPRVRWDAVAGAEDDDVAGHDLGGGDVNRLPAPEDRGGRRRHGLECTHRPLGPVFLVEAQEGADDHDAEDDRGVQRVPEDERKRRGADEQNDEEVLELVEEDQHRADLLLLSESVRPHAREADRRLLARQAAPARFQSAKRLVSRQMVPARILHGVVPPGDPAIVAVCVAGGSTEPCAARSHERRGAALHVREHSFVKQQSYALGRPHRGPTATAAVAESFPSAQAVPADANAAAERRAEGPPRESVHLSALAAPESPDQLPHRPRSLCRFGLGPDHQG